MRLRKIGLAMVVLIICLLAGGFVFFYPKKVNNTPNKTNVSLSNMPKKDAFLGGWRSFSSNASPVDNESFKKGIELACRRVDEIQEEECLKSEKLEDCFSSAPKVIQHILSVGPSLCKAKDLQSCWLLLSVLPVNSPEKKEYEEALIEAEFAKCEGGSQYYCHLLSSEDQISPEKKSQANKFLIKMLQQKCNDGDENNIRDCFSLSLELDALGKKEQTQQAKRKFKDMIHKACENPLLENEEQFSAHNRDFYCWLDILDEPECLYFIGEKECKEEYSELSDKEKNSPSYTKLVAKVKDNCLISASSCELLGRMLPPESADRVWAQNRWIQDLASKCQKNEQISDSACWTLYKKTKNTTDAHVQELRLDAKEHFLQLGLSACQKGVVEDCKDFINTLTLDEQSDFTDVLQQARLKLVELSQESCQKKRDQRSCQLACIHGKDYLLQKKN